MVFKKLLVNSLLFFSIVVNSKENEDTNVIEYCNKLRQNRKLLLVSTLDGQLTALDFNNGGQKKWNVPTEPGPLLSSTIHTMELSENSQLIRIIPSLSGGLYKFDGETIEPMPVNTDSLLKSYWDGIDISGGKEIRSYAIDIESGNALYECSMNECSNWTETSYLNSDLILLRRETQKVRAIEIQSRTERWNYSVGLHNISITHSGIPECNNNNSLNSVIKAVIPKGLLYVINKENPDEVEWEYQFDSPIVSAWTLIGSRLQWIDLFKPLRSVVKKNKTVYPTLYIGVHGEQLYIQESEPFHRNQLLYNEPRLSMKKYRLMQAFDIENKQDVIPLLTDESERNSSTALAMLYDGTEFVKGQGYYLYCAEPTGDCQPKRHRLALFSALFLTSVYYWKEAIVLLSITFCLIHYLIPCPNITMFSFGEIVKALCQRFRKSKSPLAEEVEALNSNIQEEENSGIRTSFCRTSSESETNSYRSRYLEDFEPIHCLGKGGFGVVFQARHKVDDCHYAVKRITLPDRDEARERVMREVKALAKLEHQFIVRYFQAWQECPPIGWQEEQDKLWKNKTKDEYLSSEPGGMYELSITSSTSNITSCDSRNLGVCVSSNKIETEGSDSSGIEFRNFDSDNKGKKITTVVDDVQTHVTQIVSTETDNLASNRRKFFYKTGKTSRIYLYIQMQLCRKNSLREWLCDNLKRDQDVILNMFDQIVQAVEYVHLQGLIHRDLKPSNIFFSPDGQIKVGDFGLVTEIIEDNDLINEPKRKPFFDESRTANVGTELYMSPEQILGKSYNYKVDIYSLGIILFELLTPFSTQMERHRVLTDLRENKFPKDFHIKYKDEYNLLVTMLSSSPDKRPTTFGIRSKSPFNKLYVSNTNIPQEWHFDLPYKSNSNIIRKSSSEAL